MPPTSIGVESDGPLVATSGMRLVAESELDVNCRRAIDVVTARRGLNRTNTVQLEAGLVPDGGRERAGGAGLARDREVAASRPRRR